MSPESLGELVGAVLAAAVIGGVTLWYTSSKRFDRGNLRLGTRLLVLCLVILPMLYSGWLGWQTAEEEAGAREIQQGCMNGCMGSTDFGEAGCQEFCRCQLAQLLGTRSAREAASWIAAHTRADGSQDDELARAGRDAGERCLRLTGLGAQR